VQLTQIESVFRSLKSELGIRPIYHQLEHRADAHVLIAFLAYCLQVTLKNRQWYERTSSWISIFR
jgi:transposase